MILYFLLFVFFLFPLCDGDHDVDNCYAFFGHHALIWIVIVINRQK